MIAEAERSGDLTRENFAEWEAREHFVFRAWLVQHMLDDADALALLPRRDQRRQFIDLMDVDISTGGRFTVIAEGVDVEMIDAAAAELTGLQIDDRYPEVIRQLTAEIDRMPDSRRGLPILLSAGRFSEVKGLDRVAAAWAQDPDIRSKFNLVILGGDLEHPSEEERRVLESVRRNLGRHSGSVLLGGRSHRDVARLMAMTRIGLNGYLSPDGVYISGSAKEEFGLAIVEAMGAGLPVIAPRNGGPTTYVDQGFTGYLADTHDIEDLRRGIRWADVARSSEVRADAARRLIRTRYSLSAMADDLAEIYTFVGEEATAS